MLHKGSEEGWYVAVKNKMFTVNLELTSIAGAEPDALAQAFLYLSIVDLMLNQMFRNRRKKKLVSLISFLLDRLVFLAH